MERNRSVYCEHIVEAITDREKIIFQLRKQLSHNNLVFQSRSYRFFLKLMKIKKSVFRWFTDMFKKKAIILIFTHKEEPDPFEIISFKQCCRILEQQEIRLVVPETLDISRYLTLNPYIKADRFPDMFFTNVNQYNKLKISKIFYLKYRNYNYLLTYELDAFCICRRAGILAYKES